MGTTSGWRNTAVGSDAGHNNSTGDYNTAVGDQAMYFNETGNNNTCVGQLAGPANGVINLSNIGAFGYNTIPTASNRIHIGNTTVGWIGGKQTWSTYSDERFKTNVRENVSGLDFILKLRPVTYHWDIEALNDHIGADASHYKSDVLQDAIKEQENIAQSGFIAQEVERAAHESGYDFSGLNAPPNSQTPYSLSYAEFVVPLAKAIQELSEQNQQQMELIKRLESRLQKLEDK